MKHRVSSLLPSPPPTHPVSLYVVSISQMGFTNPLQLRDCDLEHTADDPVGQLREHIEESADKVVTEAYNVHIRDIWLCLAPQQRYIGIRSCARMDLTNAHYSG